MKSRQNEISDVNGMPIFIGSSLNTEASSHLVSRASLFRDSLNAAIYNTLIVAISGRYLCFCFLPRQFRSPWPREELLFQFEIDMNIER